MSRFTPNFTAAIAAIVITLVSVQGIVTVPQTTAIAVIAPAIA